MILFNNSESNLFGNKAIWLGSSPISNMQTAKLSFSALFGEERPRDMLVLLTILVLLLHVYGLMWLLRSEEKTAPTQSPLMMEVSMISMASPKPAVVPPKPAPPTPPKKVQPKPLPKKAPPIVQKSPDFAPVETRC